MPRQRRARVPKQRKARVVVKCVRCRYQQVEYTDRGKGKCCAKCRHGASKDQQSIPNPAPMLSTRECESIIFGLASPQVLPLRVGQIYGMVRFKATIPAITGDNPQPVIWDIPVNGFFNEHNNPLVHSLIGMVDSYFVPKIVGNTRGDIDFIASACRGFGFCKLLIMAQGAQFVSSELQSDFIWLVVRQIDRLRGMSLLQVRSGSRTIDEESSSQLIIWYYAMSKLKTSMKSAKDGKPANLFGSRELFQYVWTWVGQVLDELNNRWKTACRQPGDFYKGFRTPHEEIAKIVRSFTVYFEMSMSESPSQWESPAQWESPIQPSGPVIYNDFHQSEPQTDSASIQLAMPPGREAYDDSPTVSPNSQNLGHHFVAPPMSSINNASFNPHGLGGSCRLPFNDVANRYNNSSQGNLYPTGDYQPDQYLGSFQNSQAGYVTWAPENQVPFPTKEGTMGSSPTIIHPEESHFPNQGTQLYQQPSIQRPTRSEYLLQMQVNNGITHTLCEDADTSPGCARDEDFNLFSIMHQQGRPLYSSTPPISPHYPPPW